MINFQYYPKNNMVTNNLKNIINVVIRRIILYHKSQIKLP